MNKNNLVYKSNNPSVNICYDSKKQLYRAYYHGQVIFRSKKIDRLKKKIDNWDKEFKQWYKKGNIHN